MTPCRTWRSSNGSIMPCSRAIFLIQRSALIDGTKAPALRVLPLGKERDQGRHQRQQYADEDTGCQRDIDREPCAPEREVSRQPAQGKPGVDRNSSYHHQDPEEDERAT